MNGQLAPKQHWTIARLTFWYLDRSRWRDAETLARGLLTLDRRDGLAWKYYGEARRQQEDLEEAVRAFGEAARLLEDDPDAWMRFGRCLLRLGRRDEAHQALQRALACAGPKSARRRRIEALLKMCG